MLRRYYGKISKLPIDQFTGHDGELVVDDITGKVYVMDGVTLGGTELVGATPRFGASPPASPTPGALWYDPDSGRTYIYYQSQWVDAAPNTTYTLPEASDTVLGGIKVGNNLSIDEYGVLNAEDGNYILPTANTTVLGGVKVDNVSILISGSGVISANIADIKSNISILFSNAATQASNISTLFSNATSQDTQIKGLNANITAANAAIITANVGMKSYVDVTLENVLNEIGTGLYDFYNQTNANLATLSDNANVQAITINTLTANALTQDTQIKGLSANINAANAAIIAANLLIANKNTLTNNGYTFRVETTGNVTLPTGGNINYSNGTSILDGITSGGGSSNTDPSSTPPISPSNGQLWYDTDSGRIYVYLNDAWIDTNPTLISPYYDDNNVADYLPTNEIIISLLGNTETQQNSIDYLLANTELQQANINSLLGNSEAQQNTINYLLANTVSQQANISSLRANITAANAAIITANVGMKSYVDYISTNWIANAAAQAVSINSILANISAQPGNAESQQNTINYLLANTEAQQANISSLRANIVAANAAIITANVGMKSYVDYISTNWIANAAIQSEQIDNILSNLISQTSNAESQQNTVNYLLANSVTQSEQIANIYANLSTQIGNAAAQQVTINYLLANTIAQENQVDSLRANIIAANTAISTMNFYSNSNAAAYLTTYSGSIGGTITLGTLLQSPLTTKASNATGTVGQICWDSNYIYICTATNTWKRVALTGGY